MNPTRLILLGLAICSIALACASTGTGGATTSGETPALGNARVWYAVNPEANPATERSTSSAKPLTMVFVNQSHSQYRDTVPGAMSIMNDDTMYTFLSALKEAGLFTEKGGTYIGTIPPDEYVNTLKSKPYKWIGVEHNGRYTIFIRPSDVAAEKERAMIFLRCEDIVRAVSPAAYGVGSSGQGSGIPPDWVKEMPR